MSERKIETDRTETGRPVLQLKRGLDRAAANAAGDKGQRLRNGSATRRQRPINSRTAGQFDPAACLQGGDEIGRIDCPDVLQRKIDGHHFTGVNDAVGGQAILGRQHPS